MGILLNSLYLYAHGGPLLTNVSTPRFRPRAFCSTRSSTHSRGPPPTCNSDGNAPILSIDNCIFSGNHETPRHTDASSTVDYEYTEPNKSVISARTPSFLESSPESSSVKIAIVDKDLESHHPRVSPANIDEGTQTSLLDNTDSSWEYVTNIHVPSCDFNYSRGILKRIPPSPRLDTQILFISTC